MKKYLSTALVLLVMVLRVDAQNVGVNTTTPLARLHVDLGASLSNGILFSGEEPSGGSFPSLGPGHRLMYYPGRGVFRAGYVEGTQWDNPQVGAFSFAFGYNVMAKGNGSCAIGDGTTAGGTISTAFGNSTITKGYSSFVLGMYNDPLIIGPDEDAATPQTPMFLVGNGDGNETRNNAFAVFKNGNVLLKNYSTVLADPGIVQTPVTGPGTRMMWMAEKSAFRLGTVHNNDWNADSIGTWSTGIGYSTKAKGQFSLALGLQTTASGITSTAMGYNTTARGENAISMGSVTSALGANTTSIGFKTYAGSYGSVAMGRYNDTIVNSNRTAWVGTDPMLILGNGTSDGNLHNAMVVYKNGSVVMKNPTTVLSDPGLLPIPASGPGTRMMWLPLKSAIRIGTVHNDAWDANNIGMWSTGIGFSTKASGPLSVAFGQQTTASGFSSTAIGQSTTASGESSMAMGFTTSAMGSNSTSMGFKTYAGSYGSVAMGKFNDTIVNSSRTAWVGTDPMLILGNGTSDGDLHNAMVVYKNGSMVVKNPTTVITNPGFLPTPISGPGTRMMWMPLKSALRIGTVHNNDWNADSIGTWSTGIGYSTKAKGQFSLALGLQTTASGTTSTAMGFSTTASGENSISMGSITKASGTVATAMGYDTRASGFASTAMGYGTQSNGVAATSMGLWSRAKGTISNASGLETIAKGYASTVIGQFNDSILVTDQSSITSLTPLFIIGNGDSGAPGERNNAMVVRKDGHVGIGTNVPITTLHVDVGSSITDGFLVRGDAYDYAATVPALGDGSRMMYYPGKAAFRAGYIEGGAYWDNENVGQRSVAMGFNTTASGIGGVALGAWAQAIGNTSFAVGHGPVGYGDHSAAFGVYSLALGYASMAAGEHSKAYGSHSTAIGRETHAKGTNAFSMGYATNAKGYSSMVIGMYNDSLLTTNQTVVADTTPLFIVGNGSSNANRHNAMVVYKDGITEVNGVADINGKADISGFTNLGTDAPKIKMKKLTGISQPTQNTWTNVPHGLTQSKIISVNIIMSVPTFVNVPPSYTYHSGYQYDYQVSATNIVVINSATNSANILSKAFTVLIVYEE